MAAYQLTVSGVAITRASDGAFIPMVPANEDYQVYLAWIAAGNTPDPVPTVPAPTLTQLHVYATTKAAQLLSATRSYTAAGVTMKADASAATIANLLALAQWGTTNIASSENWIANDYSIQPVTGAQFVALAPLVGAYAQLIYGTQLAAVLTQITVETITTTAQIDSYAWTV